MHSPRSPRTTGRGQCRLGRFRRPLHRELLCGFPSGFATGAGFVRFEAPAHVLQLVRYQRLGCASDDQGPAARAARLNHTFAAEINEATRVEILYLGQQDLTAIGNQLSLMSSWQSYLVLASRYAQICAKPLLLSYMGKSATLSMTVPKPFRAPNCPAEQGRLLRCRNVRPFLALEMRDLSARYVGSIAHGSDKRDAAPAGFVLSSNRAGVAALEGVVEQDRDIVVVLTCLVNRHCFQLLCVNGRRNPQTAPVGGAVSPA